MNIFTSFEISGKAKRAAPKNPHFVKTSEEITFQADIKKLVNKLRVSTNKPHQEKAKKTIRLVNEIHCEGNASQIKKWNAFLWGSPNESN